MKRKIAQLSLPKTIFRIHVILLLILCSNNLWAVTRTSTATGGNWSVGGTWVGGVAPAVGDDVVIATTGGNAVTINVASTCIGVVINSGAILTATTFGLTVNGSWTNNGTFNDGTTATVTFGGTSSINGTTNPQNFQNVSIAIGAALTINSPVALAGNFAYVASTSNSSVTIAGTNTLSVTGTWSMPRPSNGFTSTIAVGAGTLTVTGLFTLSGTNNRNTAITISTGTANLGAVTTGTVGCLVTFSGAGILNISGALSGGPPVITESTGTINFKGAAAQTVWSETYYNLTLSGGGIKTTTTVTVSNILSMEGTATASAAPTYGAAATLIYNTATARNAGAEWLATFAATGGVIIANTGAITPNGNKVFNVNIPLNINSGATLSPAARTFSFGGDLINDGTWTASTGAVTITLARTTQSIGRFNTTGLVTMSKASGTATFTANVNGGAFTMNSAAGILNLGTAHNHTFTGAWINTAGTLQGNTSTLNIGGTGSGTGVTFTAGTSTVNFNGAAAQSIPTFVTSTVFYNLNTATGGTKTLLGSTTVSNVLTVGTSSTFATGAFTLTLSGTGTPLVNSGTFTGTAGGTVIYSGATANIAAVSYASLQTSTAGVKTLAGNTTVATVLTVNSPSELQTGANTLTLSGTGTPLVDNGTFTASSGSTVIFSGATATVAGETYVNLQASTAGAKTLGANTIASGVVTINTGSTIALSTFTLTLSGTGTPLVNSGGTFTPATGTVIYSGATSNITALSYYNLQTSTAGSKTLAGTTTVTNVLTINSPSTLDLSTSTLTLSGAGTPLVNSGTFTPSTSTINFSNVASTNIPALNYYNLNITGGARVLANSGTIGIANTFTPGAGGFTLTGSTINFNGAGAQNIPTLSYNNLETSTGGTKTLLASTTVSNVLTVGASSTFATGAFTLTLSGTGTPLVNSGTFTGTAGGTVIYSGATANIAAVSYANLQTSTAGIKTLAGNTTVATVLTVNSLSTLATGANTLTLSGTGTPLVNNGTFTASAGSTVIFSGATATVAAVTYANLQVSTAGVKTLGANTTVSEVLTINTGSTIALSTFTLTLSGTGTPLVNSGGTFTASTGTVNFTGATATVAGLTYYNLQTTTSGSKTLGGTTTVSNVLTINSPSTLDLSTFTINLSLTGTPLVNNGTITGTGTVNFSGSGAQTVAGTTYPNLEFSGAGTKTISTGATVTVTINWVVGSTTTMSGTGSANVTGNISGTGAITMGSGTISLEGSWTNNGVFTAGTGTINYDRAGNQTIAALSYNNLSTAIGGVKTLAANTTVTSVMNIGNNTQLNLSTFTLFLSFTGVPLVIQGTITGTGTVNYSGSGAQTVTGTTYPNLEFSGAGTKTILTTITATVTNNWIVGSPTTLATTGSANVTGNISGTGAITMGSGTISLEGSWTNSGTFTRGTGTVIYDGTTQNITGLQYYDLQTSNSGVKTLAAATTVNNVLTIGASTTLDLSTFALTLSGAGTPLVNSGTFTCSTSTVNFSNAGSVNIPALNYNNLNLTGGARVLANSGEIGIAAVFTPGAGGFTVTGSTVNYNGAAQTIPAFTFNDLVLSGSGAKTILTATTVTVFQLSIGNGPTLDLQGTSLINITKP